MQPGQPWYGGMCLGTECTLATWSSLMRGLSAPAALLARREKRSQKDAEVWSTGRGACALGIMHTRRLFTRSSSRYHVLCLRLLWMSPCALGSSVLALNLSKIYIESIHICMLSTLYMNLSTANSGACVTTRSAGGLSLYVIRNSLY
jgi:hypothetical protein